MNLVLFDPAEVGRPLSIDDPRARHVLTVLRRRTGDTFDAGIVNGPRGKARLIQIGSAAVTFEFAASATPPQPSPISVIVGLPRPQTARDILRDATTLGVEALHFVTTAKGEPNYAQSTLWSGGEWRRHVLAGAAQAFTTRVPQVTHGRALTAAITELPQNVMRCALDNYEAPGPLSRASLSGSSFAIAIGAERGWSSEERDLLRTHGFEFAHLGASVLRTETACVAAITLLKAKLGSM